MPRYFGISAILALLCLLPFQTANAANVLAFDGSNNSVRKLSFSSGSFAQSRFSVELWFKSDAVNRGYLVQSANSSSAFDGEKIQYSMRLEVGGSVVASYGGNGSYVSAASSSSYGDGDWHHAAMTLASLLPKAEALGSEMKGELNAKIQSAIKSSLESLDVVTREEFDAQAAMLERAEARVADGGAHRKRDVMSFLTILF